MLFKLSLRNIKRSIKDYAIYFFTLVLGVAIFYIFNAIESQTAMLSVSQTTHQLLDTMSYIMTILSVLVAVILGFLIIYASRFLMKRRKKEFGIYITLGMSKSKISRILLVETIIIGLISLAVGLLLGVMLSQLVSVFVANMFEADMSSFQFVFSETAFFGTIGAFGVIYLVVMLLNTFSVNRQKLINLIHSDKTNEKVKVRNLPLCIVMMIVSIAMLVYSYIQVTSGIVDLSEEKIYLILALGGFGTLFFFWALSGIALRVLPKFHNFYYNKTHSFILREINGKVNTTIVSMTIISLLLFLTIVIFSSAMSINNTFTSDLQELAPADFQASKYVFESTESEKTELERYSHMTAIESLEELGVDIQDNFSEWADIYTYKLDTVTQRDTIGEEILFNQAAGTRPYMERVLESQEVIIKVSDYNKVARLYGNKEFELDDDEYIVLADYKETVEARNQALAEFSPSITVVGHTLTPKYAEVRDGFMEISSNRINTGIILVPDGIDLAGNETVSFFVGNYNASTKEEHATIDAEMHAKVVDNDGIYNKYMMPSSTKTEIYDQSIGISAVVTFIGLYLGTIFLISSAALLSLKELSESSDNQEKYLLLSKLGVDQKTMSRSLFAQIAIFFGLPLAVAIIHSIFGIIFVNQVMLTFMHSSLLTSIITTAIFIGVIYGGYFLITYFTSKRIVIDRN